MERDRRDSSLLAAHREEGVAGWLPPRPPRGRGVKPEHAVMGPSEHPHRSRHHAPRPWVEIDSRGSISSLDRQSAVLGISRSPVDVLGHRSAAIGLPSVS